MNEEKLTEAIVEKISEDFYIPDDVIARGITNAFIELFEYKVGFRGSVFDAISIGMKNAFIDLYELKVGFRDNIFASIESGAKEAIQEIK